MIASTRNICRTLLLLAIAASAAFAFESETEDALVVLDGTTGDSVSYAPRSQPLTLIPAETYAEETKEILTMLRGGSNDKGLELPPIPPIHPRHTGSVHYSSVMNSDGTTTYRRDINAPCDYGMLVFNVGPAQDTMPYKYELYGDAYLWSDNAGLCILYPSYTGYQLSTAAPFWKLGYDPMIVNFKDLGSEFGHMHRISSRILAPGDGSAHKNSIAINKHTAGDYVIMGQHDFYSIQYYKQLKQFINSWGMEAEAESETNLSISTTTV
eukprot:jgi/Psemu1/307166/fgenesh1_kg.307_\